MDDKEIKIAQILDRQNDKNIPGIPYSYSLPRSLSLLTGVDPAAFSPGSPKSRFHIKVILTWDVR